MNKTLIPLSRVVKASIIDTGGDIGQKFEMHSHWAARAIKELDRHSLKSGKRKMWLQVNHNTQTATLPCDFESLLFCGYIVDGKKVPLQSDERLTDSRSIETEETHLCPKCSQDTAICADLSVTETVNLLTINDTVYEETIVKKLYPNGDYYLETSTPFLNIETNTVEYPATPDRKFITNLDLTECGCLSTTPENLCTLATYCPDTYGCYFAGCSPCTVDYGGYRIFEETGLIQLDLKYSLDNLYIEYVGFLTKIKGQYYVPAVAFEATVERVKFMSVDGKSSVSNPDKRWRWEMYKIAKGNMNKILGRVSLSAIMNAAAHAPQFTILYDSWYDCCLRNAAASAVADPAADTACGVEIPDPCCVSGDSVVTYITIELVFRKRKWIVGDVGAPMADGDTVYVIEQGGVAERNVKEGSVNVVVDGVPIQEDESDQLSFHVDYAAAATTVTFNQGLLALQKVTVSYAKTV